MIKTLDYKDVKLSGNIRVPGDKSISHRSVMFGALANGTTTVTGFLKGDDCLSTIDCFRKMGVTIEENGDTIVIHGKGFEGLREPEEILNVGNSGTTTRLLLGILAGLPFHTVIIGDESIAKRPMKRVTDPLRKMGAAIDGREDSQYTPLAVRGGTLSNIHYTLPYASAQLKSALIFAGLHTEGVTTIVEPEKTRDHTEQMIKQFGGTIERSGNEIYVKGSQSFVGQTIDVPGDISSAAFFLVAGAVVKKSKLLLHHVGLNPTRTGIIDVLLNMGADVVVEKESTQGEPLGKVTISEKELTATQIGGALIPRLIDEIPIIALLATQAQGTTVIKDAEELKVKETNRIDAVAGELAKLGANIEPTDDGLLIHGPTKLHGGQVDSRGDHRIGMMLAVAALLTDEVVTIEGVEAIGVSYPQFFSDLESVIL
ncbi:3-phosphoshikimate 1-carboxyvinyltransferase [Jeotgalibacillus marinus]|uniref:3-phosphoshikimate 1-carboxyvinyltransferase n=1 Tax=Jeotgalibacillus marinus TaxID=86667 RepID=A0ABV3PYP3_9BACL